MAGAAALCPECRHALAVPERYVGKMWRCPDCRTRFVPPAPPPAAAPAPARRGLFRRLLEFFQS